MRIAAAQEWIAPPSQSALKQTSQSKDEALTFKPNRFFNWKWERAKFSAEATVGGFLHPDSAAASSNFGKPTPQGRGHK